MDKQHTDIEWIDGYVSGHLSKEHKEYVKKRIAEDSDFKDLYEQYSAIIQAIRFSPMKEKLVYLTTLEKCISDMEHERTDSIFDGGPDESEGSQYRKSKVMLFDNTIPHFYFKTPSWKSYFLAAVVIFPIALTYMYINLKKPPHAMECVVSVNTHKCV